MPNLNINKSDCVSYPSTTVSTTSIASEPTTEMMPLIINDGDLEFHIGFHLDGFTEYENMSSALPEYSQIDVYYDPDIYPWESTVSLYPIWPFYETHISMQVG